MIAKQPHSLAVHFPNVSQDAQESQISAFALPSLDNG
jgi:hypothetical protein